MREVPGPPCWVGRVCPGDAGSLPRSCTFHARGNVVNGSIDALIEELLHAIPAAFLSRILSALDDHAYLRFSPRDRRVGGQFGRKLATIPDGHFFPVRGIHRNAFLWGCANFVRAKRHEWMILGFGHKEGSSTPIEHVRKLRGGAHVVSLGAADIAHIHTYLNSTPRGAVIAAHNHPDHLLHDILATLFGGDPIPSLRDRDSALAILLQRLDAAAAGGEFGRVKFFVIQHNEVKEFSGALVGAFADLVRGVCRSMPR